MWKTKARDVVMYISSRTPLALHVRGEYLSTDSDGLYTQVYLIRGFTRIRVGPRGMGVNPRGQSVEVSNGNVRTLIPRGSTCSAHSGVTCLRRIS